MSIACQYLFALNDVLKDVSNDSFLNLFLNRKELPLRGQNQKLFC